MSSAGQWQVVLSNHLPFEHEEVAKRNSREIDLTLQDVDNVLDALCSIPEYQQLEPDWIPRLNDPDDEPLLQMAVEGRLPIIVTRNVAQLSRNNSVAEKITVWKLLVLCKNANLKTTRSVLTKR